MALFSEFRPILSEIARSLRIMSAKSCCATITSTGTGDIPAGYKSISVVKTSDNSDTVTITLSDASVYTMTEQGEVFSQSSPNGGSLPAYTFGGTGTFKWHGVQ